MVLVDVRETLSARASDLFLQIRPGADLEVLTALRAHRPRSSQSIAALSTPPA